MTNLQFEHGKRWPFVITYYYLFFAYYCLLSLIIAYYCLLLLIPEDLYLCILLLISCIFVCKQTFRCYLTYSLILCICKHLTISILCIHAYIHLHQIQILRLYLPYLIIYIRVIKMYLIVLLN